MDVLIPKRFSVDGIKGLKDELDRSQYIDSVTVDFSNLEFSYPIGMLVAGSYLRRWISVRREVGLETFKRNIKESLNVISYLKHLGFFDFICMDGVGNKIGTAKGNTKYIPIREIRREDLSVHDGATLMESIIFISEGIAGVIAAESENPRDKLLYGYVIREVLRNVFEHSEATSCFLCAQRWVNGKVEIAILDEGVGIGRTLRPVYHVESNEVLSAAIKPGVTKVKNMTSAENIYDNSGYGLYVLSELGNSFGWFLIGSGEYMLKHQNSMQSVVEQNFDGTFVGLHLDLLPRDFSSVLNDIIEVGEQESIELGDGTMASSASKKAIYD